MVMAINGYTIDFLVSSKIAIEGRVARKAKYKLLGEHFKYVVHVETHGNMKVPDRFVELDAESIEHAHDLADTWVVTMGNCSASARKVKGNGTLEKICFIR